MRKARPRLEFPRDGGPLDCDLAFQDFRGNTRAPDWKSHFPCRSTKADVPAKTPHLVREELARQPDRRGTGNGAAKAGKIIHGDPVREIRLGPGLVKSAAPCMVTRQTPFFAAKTAARPS